MVFNSYTESGLSLENINRIIIEFYHGQYSPLNQLFYTILYSIAGYTPAVYHIFSILLHILNVVIAFLLLASLLTAMGLERPSFRGRRGDMNATAAFIAALLFAVHPVNVETVSWVSASKIVLYSFNYLMGLYLYVRYTESRSRLTYIIILLLFILAFGAKEQAVAFVLCCMVIDYAVKRKEDICDLFLEKFPMVLLALFFGVLTMMTHWHSGSGRMPEYNTLTDHMVLASYSIIEYVVTMLIPCSLSYIYPFPYQPGENIPLYVWAYPILLLFASYLIYILRKNRLFIFAVLFFLANLVLMLHFIPMSRFTVVCDRYLYVALLGPAVLVGWLTAYGLRSRRILAAAIMVPYLFYLSAYTFTYQSHWDNSSDLKKEIRQLLKEREMLDQNH